MVGSGHRKQEVKTLKIKQVEELVGITKKNIRFYEDQGLLQVQRAENGYREYCLEDVRRLQEIKLLRKLSVPIEEMKLVFAGRCSLSDCLERQAEVLEHQKKDLESMRSFCLQMLEGRISIESLNAEQCLEQMEQLEREGVNFMDVRKQDTRRKKLAGAVMGAIVMVILMAVLIGIMVWGYSEDPIPIGFLLFLIGIPTTVVIGAIAALVGRVREIEGGEEDEAAKY